MTATPRASAAAVAVSATSAAAGSSVRVRPHRSFALVLSGGGARGLAHAGVLRALEHYGYAPSAIVGVSMGAVVGATYALNPDWYQALKTMNTTGFPQPTTRHSSDLRERTRVAVALQRALSGMVLGWGAGVPALAVGQALLDRLTLKRNLEDGRIPIVATATDLVSGARVVMRSGNAARALYASSALAGILPPLHDGEQLLADGAYADVAPVDVARALGASVVIAVDIGNGFGAKTITTGFQALIRSIEIYHHQHGQARFDRADLVLRPVFTRPIDMLDFQLKRECVVAGLLTVRRALPVLRAALEVSP